MENEKLWTVDERLSFVEKTVVKIETDHGPKIKALLNL